jgi:hypothetical protein
LSADETGESANLIYPAGKIWQPMVAALLTAQLDRRKAIEGRGATLMTASASIITLIFGLSVLVTGKDVVFENRWAVWTLIPALIAFVVSAAIALFVQTHGAKYEVISRDSLRSLTRASFWTMSADPATRADVSQHVRTICGLRDVNDTKTLLAMWSLGFQLAAIALLSMSVGLELSGRL